MSHFFILPYSANCFVPLTSLVTLFDRKLLVFKKSQKLTTFGIFNELFPTQNVNVARIVECDFLCDFQTLWVRVCTSFFVGSWFTVGGCIDVSGADIWERKGGKFMIAISECLHYSVSSLAYITYQNPLSLVLHDNCKSFWDTTIWEGQVLFQKRLLMSWDL